MLQGYFKVQASAGFVLESLEESLGICDVRRIHFLTRKNQIE